MKHLQIGNDKIAFRQIGDKNSQYTLLFIHGATMTGKAMIPLAKSFLNFNCIVVDLPGHGSSIGETKTSIEAFADSIDLLMQELLKKHLVSNHITLIGYSLGGVIAFELALKKREEYKRLIVLSSGVNLNDYSPLMHEAKSKGIAEFNSSNFFEHAFGSGSTKKQIKMLVNILNKTKVDDSIGYQDLILATNYNKSDRVDEILIPVFIFTGGEDKIILPNCDIDLWKGIKNAYITVVPFRGHTAIFEEMGYLVTLINDFFKYH